MFLHKAPDSDLILTWQLRYKPGSGKHHLSHFFLAEFWSLPRDLVHTVQNLLNWHFVHSKWKEVTLGVKDLMRSLVSLHFYNSVIILNRKRITLFRYINAASLNLLLNMAPLSLIQGLNVKVLSL